MKFKENKKIVSQKKKQKMLMLSLQITISKQIIIQKKLIIKNVSLLFNKKLKKKMK